MKLKSIIVGAAALVLGAVSVPAGSSAADGVLINSVNFPDDIFRQYVTSYDIDKNGTLSAEELEAVSTVNVHGRGINDLAGIGYFSQLRTLNCSSNNLKSLDIKGNTMLAYLNAGSNGITSLDISRNLLLRSVICSDNRISALDVSGNTALNYIDVSGNELTSLDVSKCAGLSTLNISDNQITTVRLNDNRNLSSLTANGNNITSLDVSGNTGLVSVNVSGNNLRTLDVRNNTLLMSLDCSDNGLLALNLPGSVRSVDCSNNKLQILDLRGLANIYSLDVSNNSIYALDITSCPELVSLAASGNKIAAIDVSGSPKLSKNPAMFSNNKREVYVNSNGEIDTEGTGIEVDNIVSIATAGVVTGQALTADVTGSALIVSDIYKMPSEISYSYDMGGGEYYSFVLKPYTAKKLMPAASTVEVYAPNENETVEFPLYVTAIGGGASITYASADSAVVSVTADGMLRVIAPGETTVTASADGYDSALFTIKVYKQNTDISVSDVSDQFYTGSEVRPAVEIKDGGTILKENTDYTLTYENNINVGVAVVTIRGCGRYSFKMTKKFNIVYNIANVTAAAIPDQLYTGNAIMPEVSLTNGTYKLEKGKDYTLEYTNNINLGTGIVTITGIGQYSGVKILSFNIIVPQVTNLIKTGNYKTQMKLSWDKIEGVSGYRIYRYNPETKKYVFLKQLAGSDNNTYQDTGLIAGTYYKYRVRAYITVNGTKNYGKYCVILKTYTKFKKVSSFKVTAGTKKATIKWKKMAGVTGYRVYMKNSAGKYTKITELKGAGKVSYTKTGLAKNKSYSFKVRVFKTVGGKNIYGAYTAVKTVKVK